ncbi:hypothetical protein DL93DRAFT_2068381 [Clavulina sp. PMI_390]|nr:hypothetical protein DL93DRAFT_2068381 [Clavulina sp. PMI_390]
MSLNDKDITLGGPQGTDVYSGVANPAPFGNGNPYETNFIKNPMSEEMGAGAGPDFNGGRDAKKSMRAEAGVVEGAPGIIESSTIDPLDPNRNIDEEYAKKPMTFNSTPSNTTAGYVSTATDMASGASKMAYGHATGDQATLEQGRQEWSGANK